MASNVSIKFNNGNTLLLFDGAGSATLSSLGLCFRDEVDRLAAELTATEALVEALQSELATTCERAAESASGMSASVARAELVAAAARAGERGAMARHEAAESDLATAQARIKELEVKGGGQ